MYCLNTKLTIVLYYILLPSRRFLLQVVGVVGQEVRFRCTDLTSSSAEYAFLCQELAHLLLYITHMFQSGESLRI